jgi:hypothetical protein
VQPATFRSARVVRGNGTRPTEPGRLGAQNQDLRKLSPNETMLGMKRLLLIVVGAAGLFGADLNGKWNFIWQTPGGERRSTLTFKQNAENVEAHFPDGKEPITGTFKDGKLLLSGRLFSSEAGEAADFRLDGTLSEGKLKGTGGWGEHQLTFTARKAN